MIYYAVACDPYYLEHSGVKGMRWGHRKYPEAYYARAMRKMGRIDRAIDRN